MPDFETALQRQHHETYKIKCLKVHTAVCKNVDMIIGECGFTSLTSFALTESALFSGDSFNDFCAFRGGFGTAYSSTSISENKQRSSTTIEGQYQPGTQHVIYINQTSTLVNMKCLLYKQQHLLVDLYMSFHFQMAY